MLYVGLDVHLRTSSWCILDQNGKTIKEETLRGDIDAVVARLSEIREAWSVCFEASCGYGTLYEKLIRVAQRVVVAHPGRLRLIFKSKKKFDRVDGRKLAKILYLDEVPQVWVPPVQVRKWREVVEFRKRLSEEERRLADQRVAGHDWNQIAATFGGSPEALRKQLARAVDRVSCELGLDDPDE